MEWNNINVIFPPENERVLICYKEANRRKVGVFYWTPVGYRRIWVGSIKEKNISHWASIGEIPTLEPLSKEDRFNLAPINDRFEIMDL
jgi:hypothetical protein